MASQDVSVFHAAPDEVLPPSEIAQTLAKSTNIYVDLAPSLGPAITGGAGLSAADAQRINDNETGVAANDARIAANEAEIASNDAALAAHDTGIASNAALAAANDARIAAEEAATAAHNARITANEASLSANALAITSNDTDIANNLAQITANTSAITANGALITSNDTDIANNATAIAANDADIATSVAAIATNTADVATNRTDIAANNAAHAANATAIAANQASIAANNATAAANAAEIAANDSDIADNATLGAANAALAAANDALAKANEVRITANDALIASNVAKGASNEGRIVALENEQQGGSLLDNSKTWNPQAAFVVFTTNEDGLVDKNGNAVPKNSFVQFYSLNDDPPAVANPMNATAAEIANFSLVGARGSTEVLEVAPTLMVGNKWVWDRTDAIPDHLLPLNGQTVTNVDADYPELWAVRNVSALIASFDDAAKTIALKNYNGEGRFFRAGATAGIEQAQAIQSHNHSGRLNLPRGDQSWGNGGGNGVWGWTNNRTWGLTIDATGGPETRPINVSEIVCIIAKPWVVAGDVTVNVGTGPAEYKVEWGGAAGGTNTSSSSVFVADDDTITISQAGAYTFDVLPYQTTNNQESGTMTGGRFNLKNGAGTVIKSLFFPGVRIDESYANRPYSGSRQTMFMPNLAAGTYRLGFVSAAGAGSGNRTSYSGFAHVIVRQ